MTKSPGETVKLHWASFRQNVFDISGTGGYNKDVETPTVATNIEQLSVCEFFIHKPVSRLIAADGSLFSFSKPVDDLANQPEDRKYPEQVLKCYMYHLLRDISRRGYTCLPPFRPRGMTGNRL